MSGKAEKFLCVTDNNGHPECSAPYAAAKDAYLWRMSHRKLNKIKGSHLMQIVWIQNNEQKNDQKTGGFRCLVKHEVQSSILFGFRFAVNVE